MSARRLPAVIVTVLLGGILTEPGLGQVGRPSNVDDLRDRLEDPRRLGTDEIAPDHPNARSLTPEERRERTKRRKLRRVDELIERGQYEEGAALLESLRVGRSARDFAHVQNTLAFAYSQSDQPDKAIRHYQRVLRLPGVPESMGLSAERQLAKLYYGQGREEIWDEDAEPRFRQALSSMETWLTQSPNKDSKDYLFLSRIQVELNDLPGGIESLETAIRLAEERGLPIEEEWNALLDRMKSAISD